MSDYCNCCTSNVQHIADHYDPSGLTGPGDDARELLELFRRSFGDCDLKLSDVQAYVDSRTRRIHAGYVLTDAGEIFLQLPDNNAPQGFSIHDDDETWTPGVTPFPFSSWTPLEPTDPRITSADRDRLQWILDEATRETVNAE